jgi:hypothetical protein
MIKDVTEKYAGPFLATHERRKSENKYYGVCEGEITVLKHQAPLPLDKKA